MGDAPGFSAGGMFVEIQNQAIAVTLICPPHGRHRVRQFACPCLPEFKHRGLPRPKLKAKAKAKALLLATM
jgi:hypothetical protein